MYLSAKKLHGRLQRARRKCERLKHRVHKLESITQLSPAEIYAIKWFSRETNEHIYPLSAEHARVLQRLIRKWRLD